MFRSNKRALVTAVAVAVLMSSPAAHAQTISVGVAANFNVPLASIVALFQSANPGYFVTQTSKSTGALEADIIAGGNTGPYDLFLAADQAAPQDLYANHNSLVIGTPFTYATGTLMLWSNTTGVDISAGLPTTFKKTVIADPKNAPYGFAASQILAAAPYKITLPDSRVDTRPDIGSTFTAVADEKYLYGFVAKSQICSDYGSEYIGTSHHEYTSGYTPLVQDGIMINRKRTSGQETVLKEFVNFLLKSPDAQDRIEYYCYAYPGSGAATAKKPRRQVRRMPEPAR